LPDFSAPSGASVSTFGVERGAEEPGSDAYQDLSGIADRNTGLALLWSHWHLHSFDGGTVTGTDAPLGPILTSEQQRAMQGPWPVEGSFVEQFWCKEDPGRGWCGENFTAQRYEFHGGSWVPTSCTGMMDGVEINQVPTGQHPAFGVDGAAIESAVRVDRLSGCGMNTTELIVRPTAVQGVWLMSTMEGVVVEAHLGTAPSWSDKEKQALWDVESLLVLEMTYSNERMWIADTDLRLI